MIINPTSVTGDRDKCTPLVLLTCPSPEGVVIMKLKYSFLIKAGIKRLFLTLLTSWGYSEHSLLWVQSKAEDCELNLTRGVGTESSWKSCAKPRRKNFPWRCQDWAAPLGRGSWGGCAGAQLSLARLGGRILLEIQLCSGTGNKHRVYSAKNIQPQAPALLACPFHITISSVSWQFQVDARSEISHKTL